MRQGKLRALAAIVWIVLLLPGCRAADSVGVIFRAHYEDFQEQLSLLQGEMRQYDPAVREDCEAIAGRMEGNDHLILMHYSLEEIVSRMETLSFCTENFSSLSDGQKQELGEAYAAVFG